jgi:NAD(P) transhydrogenase subunit alpha
MIIGILKETGKENRVAMLPGEVSSLRKLGVEVVVELHAGEKAYASDDDYVSSGATMAQRSEVIAKAAMLLSVNPPLGDDIASFREGQILC